MNNSTYPAGLKPGDFIQADTHFGDVFFEVLSCHAPTGSNYWSIIYAHYGKYDSQPSQRCVNSAGAIKRMIPGEMAIPVMKHHQLRFHAKSGQFDPFFGFAPVGTPMRKKEAWPNVMNDVPETAAQEQGCAP